MYFVNATWRQPSWSMANAWSMPGTLSSRISSIPTIVCPNLAQITCTNVT